MPIHVIQGKPGGGKSYQAVQRAMEAVNLGRPVITNLPLIVDHPFWAKAIEDNLLTLYRRPTQIDGPADDCFANWNGWSSLANDPERHYRNIATDKKGGTMKTGPLIIIDEAKRTLTAWATNKKRYEEWMEFSNYLTMHRHYLHDIIFLYQNYGQLTGNQSDIKGIVDRWYTTTNTSEMTGANTWKMVAKASGFGMGSSANLDEKSGTFKKNIFELYDSYSEGEGAGTAGKKTAIGLFKSRPIWLRWWFILLVICIIALPILMYRSARGITGIIDVDTPRPGNEFGSQKPPPIQNRLPVSQPLRETISGSGSSNAAFTVKEQAKIVRNGVDLPSPSVPFKGYDSYELYFVDGSRASILSHYDIAGYRLIKLEACFIQFAQSTVLPGEEREIIEYRCERGF